MSGFSKTLQGFDVGELRESAIKAFDEYAEALAQRREIAARDWQLEVNKKEFARLKAELANRAIEKAPPARDWDDENQYETCPTCNGEGELPHDCGEDSCCCLDPSPEPCLVCGGDGNVWTKARSLTAGTSKPDERKD